MLSVSSEPSAPLHRLRGLACRRSLCLSPRLPRCACPTQTVSSDSQAALLRVLPFWHASACSRQCSCAHLPTRDVLFIRDLLFIHPHKTNRAEGTPKAFDHEAVVMALEEEHAPKFPPYFPGEWRACVLAMHRFEIVGSWRNGLEYEFVDASLQSLMYRLAWSTRSTVLRRGHAVVC